MTTTLNAPRYDATLVDWSGIERGEEAVVEASRLTNGAGRLFGGLYADAVDEGFVLVNQDTGSETTWVLEREVYERRNGERELIGWRLRLDHSGRRRFPKLADAGLFVAND